jgi:hypothetical protein
MNSSIYRRVISANWAKSTVDGTLLDGAYVSAKGRALTGMEFSEVGDGVVGVGATGELGALGASGVGMLGFPAGNDKGRDNIVSKH